MSLTLTLASGWSSSCRTFTQVSTAALTAFAFVTTYSDGGSQWVTYSWGNNSTSDTDTEREMLAIDGALAKHAKQIWPSL